MENWQIVFFILLGISLYITWLGSKNPEDQPAIIRKFFNEEIKPPREDQPKPIKSVPQLIQELTGNDEWLAADAAEQLGEIGDKRAIPALLKEMRYETSQLAEYDEYVQQEIEKGRDIMEGLSAMIVIQTRDDLSAIRAYAALALGKIGDPSIVDDLIETMQTDPEIDMRGTVSRALDMIGTDDALAAVEAWRHENVNRLEG